MEDFIACFGDVPDPRDENARHNLHEILMIALCSMLCGGEDCSNKALFGRAKEPFLRQFLTLKHGIPSHDTFSRVFRLLDPAAFSGCFSLFMRRFTETLKDVVAIDGKTLRHSFDKASCQSPLRMLHACGSWTLLEPSTSYPVGKFVKFLIGLERFSLMQTPTCGPFAKDRPLLTQMLDTAISLNGFEGFRRRS